MELYWVSLTLLLQSVLTAWAMLHGHTREKRTWRQSQIYLSCPGVGHCSPEPWSVKATHFHITHTIAKNESMSLTPWHDSPAHVKAPYSLRLMPPGYSTTTPTSQPSHILSESSTSLRDHQRLQHWSHSPHLHPDLTLVTSVSTWLSHPTPLMLSSLTSFMMTFPFSLLQPPASLATLGTLSSL